MKTGLVLEGGGMRGVFTAGVLDFFLKKNIEFENILAVSAGSCHAVSYLSKQYGRAFAVSVDYLSDKRYCGLYSLLTTGDLFGADMLYNKIPNELNLYDYGAFDASPAKFQAVITSCETGKAEYPVITDLRKDIQIIRASSSLPMVSKPVEINGKLYFDGGIADSIPLGQSIKQGNEKNVVVLTQHREYVKKPSSMMKITKLLYRKYPNLIRSMEHRHEMYNAELELIRKEEEAGRAFVIAPELPLPVDRIEKDKEKLRTCYKIGYNTAEKSYNELLEFLNI